MIVRRDYGNGARVPRCPHIARGGCDATEIYRDLLETPGNCGSVVLDEEDFDEDGRLKVDAIV